MKKNVFISSTYSDLQNYRRKVWDLLEKYDVSLIGMEKFGARKESPLITCLAEVEQSDIFICIVAMKLGSVDKKSGKSFTQLEYEKAYLLNKEILIYLADEKQLRFSIDDIDFDENREKLKAFKNTIKERHTVDFFSSEDDLINKLKRRFDDLLKKKENEKIENGNEYEESKKIIDKFFIAPKLFSSKELKLKVKFKNEPFPASKNLCKTFNLEYGKTIGIDISVLQPSIKIDFPQEIFISGENVQLFLDLDKGTPKDIIANLEFSENKISELRANFLKKVYYEGGIYSTAFIPSFGLEVGLGEKKIIEAEGQVILHLTDLL
jgi:hypothetical protein